MASFSSSFLNSGPGSCNTTSQVFQFVTEACKPYIDSLQTCAVTPVNQQTRFQIVNQTANCIGLVWETDANSALYDSYIADLGSPPQLTRNESCKYPDFMPILQHTCAFDYSQMSITCTDSGVYAWNMSRYLDCATETTLQYWRCTQQKAYDDIAACVEQTAVKVDWMPQFQVYDGAKSCPKTSTYIIAQALSMASSLLYIVLSKLYGRQMWEMIKARFRSSKSPPRYQLAQDEIRRPETRYVLKAHKLLKSVGEKVLTAYLTVLVLHRSHTSGILSMSQAFWQAILLYSVRPRNAPFTGLLGFYHGFSETGFADVFADGMLSWVAGTSLLVRYWYIFTDPPSNPAAPLAALAILGHGALLSSAPAFIFLALILLLSWVVTADLVGGFFIFLAILGIIMAFLCFLPILGVVEMIAMAVNKIRARAQHQRLDGEKDASRWGEGLVIDWPAFRKAYALMVASSIVINVGNWMFFVMFLKLQGDLFCPSDASKVTLIWILVPLLINLIFSVFESSTDVSAH